MRYKRSGRDIVHRWEENPIIDIEDIPFRCSDILNAGALKMGDKYLLLVTIESLSGRFFICIARSDDGYHFKMEKKPFIRPCGKGRDAIYEEWGVLDPRVVLIKDIYYISYTALGPHGFRMGLAKTKDFKTIKRMGIISNPDTKGGVLFPEKIGGKWARLERPGAGNGIWISYSDDLEYWGWSDVIMTPRGGFWDWHRIGVAVPPLRIDKGWLVIYYGAKDTSAGALYRMGATILDINDPTKVIGRTNVPILSPREVYERIGDVPNIVFSCGAVIEPDNEVKIYYGAARSCICMGTTTVQEIVNACMEGKKEF